MTQHLPPIAIVLGLAGLIPFVACGLGAVLLGAEGVRISLLALLAYSAVILAFLGAVHWGFALTGGEAQDERVRQRRYALGVVPALVGWAGLLVAFLGLPTVGLAVQLAGFIGVVITEARADRRGTMPHGYMGLRWVLSAGVILCLTCVVLVRMFGAQVVF